ncbi:hypothetical protein NQ318_016282 [Aromia moschata]|uniref:Uncharacterized protein n=1 Tax=Aromia moschata TaxID=1265417 RepID=A0AAV8XYF4_9CUCU|nr:hypothetical protein NQ318_016282 [Aromia moschata]
MVNWGLWGLLIVRAMGLESENIPFAAYECSWPDATNSFKKELLYFMLRTQTPIQLYAIDFFQISVQTFLASNQQIQLRVVINNSLPLTRLWETLARWGYSDPRFGFSDPKNM